MQLSSQKNNSTRATQTLRCPGVFIRDLYDKGIAACHARDKERVQDVVTELMSTLNYDCNEIAKSFYELHEFSLRLLDDDGFEGVEDVLDGLKTAWEKVMPVTEGTSQMKHRIEE